MIRTANDALLLRNPQTATLNITRAETAVNYIETKDSIGLLYAPQDYYENIKENIAYLKGETYNQIGNYQQTINILTDFENTYKESKLINYVNMALGFAYLNLEKFNEAKYYELC